MGWKHLCRLIYIFIISVAHWCLTRIFVVTHFYAFKNDFPIAIFCFVEMYFVLYFAYLSVVYLCVYVMGQIYGYGFLRSYFV